MKKVWIEIIKQNIPFLTIHDEILCKKRHINQIEEIIKKIFDKEFKYYSINNKLLNKKEESKIESTGIQFISKYDFDFPDFNVNEKQEIILENWLEELEEYIQLYREKYISNSLPLTIKLNNAETIIDSTKFISSYYNVLKCNNGNPTFKPMFEKFKDLKSFL